MHARSSELENLATNLFERRKIKKSFAVIAKISFRTVSALHPIGSHKFTRGGIAHHQMITDEIKRVTIQPGLRRSIQSFSDLAFENEVTQALAFGQILEVLRKPNPELAGCGEWILAVMHQDGGRWNTASFERSRLQ